MEKLFELAELEAAHNACLDAKIDIDSELRRNQLFKQLVVTLMCRGTEATLFGGVDKAAGVVMALLQIGISIGRNQVTKELIEDIK